MRRADQRKYHYIYKITRVDGKYYIGMHSTDDLEDGYFGSGQRLWKSIKKHGKEKHAKEILEFLSSRKELISREKELVTKDTLKDDRCMNLVEGGGYLFKSNDRTSKRRSEAMKAHFASEKGQITKAKISAANIGQKRTEEQRLKCAESAKIRMARMREDGSWEEVKRKNGEAHQGKKQTAETIAKRMVSIQAYKDANGGKRTFSLAARANISASLKGSARNVKTWIVTAVDGDEQTVQNLQQWIRQRGLKIVGLRIFDETGTKYRVRKYHDDASTTSESA